MTYFGHMPHKPLSVAQAALQTGIPKRTLQRSIKNGHLKAHKLGDATFPYVIDPDDLDEYVASREAAS